MSTPTGPWENALNNLAGTDQAGDSATRYDVANTKQSGDWLANHGVELRPVSGFDPKAWDVTWYFPSPFSVTTYYGEAQSYTGDYYMVAHANGNWFGDDADKTGWETTGSPWNKFCGFGSEVLGPLRGSPWENNGTTSLVSFDAAVNMLNGVAGWITTLQQDVMTLADTLNVEDSDLQGSAAGELKSYLESLRDSLGQIATGINWNGNPSALIGTAKTTLQSNFDVLQTAHDLWWKTASPINYLNQALSATIGNSQITVTSTNNFTFHAGDGTDVTTDDFWKTVETNGKNLWLASVASILDPAANTFAGAIAPVFQNVSKAVKKNITMTAPAGKALPPPTPPGTGGGGGAGGGAGDGGLGGGGGGAGAGAGGGGNKDLHMPPPPPPPVTKSGSGIVPPPITQTGSGPGGGQRQQLLGPDGKPLPGMTAPAGSHIDADGHVIGPDGKPVLGPDGKPEIVPKGSTMGPPIASSFGGGPYMVPPGSTVDGNGMVIGPDGKPVLDRNGNKVYAGKGAKIDKDGKVLDPNGNPVDDQSQLLADEEHAMGDSLAPLNPSVGGGLGYIPPMQENFGNSPFTSDLSGFTGESLSPSIGGLGGALGSGLGEGLSTLPPISTVGGVSSASGPGNMGLSEKAMAAGATLSPKDLAAQEALSERAEQAAAGEAAAGEEAQMMGRNMATTGGAGMPPMMPPGGAGAGAGAGQNDKERQRTTWLSEEEEVWGTDSGTIGGVIGR